jgi:histidinol-phosphate aminotransferase
VLDLCTGQNRLGPPEAVARAQRDADSDAASNARRAVAERFGVTPTQVALGPGVNGLLVRVAEVLVGPGSTWLSVEPAVTSFTAAARAAGARVTQWRAVERREHRVELDQVAELARLTEPRVISLSAPADPSGTRVPFAELCAWAQQLPDVTFVVDQSWLGLSDDFADLELAPPANVVCLRSLSVELALSDLRAGYALCAPSLAARIQAPVPPSAAAAITAAMHAGSYLEHCRSELRADALRLRQLLAALQLTHSPSVAPFALVRVARAQEVAAELITQHQIAVYDATRVGLPDHLRIAAPSVASLPQLQAALEQVLERRGLVRGREV